MQNTIHVCIEIKIFKRLNSLPLSFCFSFSGPFCFKDTCVLCNLASIFTDDLLTTVASDADACLLLLSRGVANLLVRTDSFFFVC